jgi:hypothetical protein
MVIIVVKKLRWSGLCPHYKHSCGNDSTTILILNLYTVWKWLFKFVTERVLSSKVISMQFDWTRFSVHHCNHHTAMHGKILLTLLGILTCTTDPEGNVRYLFLREKPHVPTWESSGSVMLAALHSMAEQIEIRTQTTDILCRMSFLFCIEWL